MKKYFSRYIPLIFLILFLVMSAVNAAENDTNLTQTSDEVVLVDVRSFDELSNEIANTAEYQTMTLEKDYEYVSGQNKGIVISKPITIDGAGHTLNGNSQSRMFNITSDNVVIKNIHFVNGNAYGKYFSSGVGGGAIYWSGANGRLDNCSFTDNAGRGIEDDGQQDGTLYRFMPMGAKVNEGGAIVWSGANGVVSNSIFINNAVGYPNSGGAICWRGNGGKVINSIFHKNDAWCGAAIAWIGDNGLIDHCEISDNGFFDAGIYWFGHNGVVKNSILLGDSSHEVLRSSYGDVIADYNFWGDTLDKPNQSLKPKNVKIWIVMTFTHNGEFIKKGESVSINYDITTLLSNGKLLKYYELSDKYHGEIYYTAPKTGFLDINFKGTSVKVSIDTKDKIKSRNLKVYYSKKIAFKVKVSDILGKVVNGKVKFTIKKKSYYSKTNKKGIAVLKLKLRPGKYIIKTEYGRAKVKNKIIVKTTLITKNLVKKYKKSAKFKVKVLNSKGKAYPKRTVKIKFKGKTYKFKTNKKGISTFKIPNNLKAGKYKIKTIYGELSNSNKIIVKK